MKRGMEGGARADAIVVACMPIWLLGAPARAEGGCVRHQNVLFDWLAKAAGQTRMWWSIDCNDSSNNDDDFTALCNWLAGAAALHAIGRTGGLLPGMSSAGDRHHW